MPSVIDLLRGISIFALLTVTVSLATFGLGVAYAMRPAERTLMLMRPMTLAAIFAAVSGLFSGWIFVLSGIAATPDGHREVKAVYLGLAESLTLGFLCFGFLAAAWLLAAVGMLRRGSVVP